MQDGTFKLNAYLPTEEERRLFGIFVSHSSKDNDYLTSLTDAMTARGLNPIYDRDFLFAGDRFQEKIEKCLNCYAGVVIVTEHSLSSDWVNYELGYFAGQGIPIVLWDPNGILSLENVDHDVLNSHFSQYLPSCDTIEQVVDKLDNLTIYSNLFEDECPELTQSDFKEILNQRVETVMVKIESDVFDTEAAVLDGCMIGSLIVNFGMFHPNNGDGVRCFAEKGQPELVNRRCAYSGMECALYDAKTLDGHNIECVVLNHVLKNGRFHAKGETDTQGQILEHGCFTFYLPVHKLFGTEFKFIVDAPSNAQHYKLIALFEKAGMNPSVSDSLNGNRIYLSLPSRPRRGFFQLDHAFRNNFLCPYSTRKQ